MGIIGKLLGLNQIAAQQAAILANQATIIQELQTMGTSLTQLTADFNAYQANVQSALNNLKSELATALAGQGIPASVQSQIDALDAAVNADNAALTGSGTTSGTTGSGTMSSVSSASAGSTTSGTVVNGGTATAG